MIYIRAGSGNSEYYDSDLVDEINKIIDGYVSERTTKRLCILTNKMCEYTTLNGYCQFTVCRKG